jgi:hypothetical protein
MRTIFAGVALSFALAAGALAQDEAPPPPPPSDGGVTVPGIIERPVPTPPGDARTPRQRMRDIRNWDRCVLRAQAQADTDPMRPQLETPEDYCRERLGMADRLAVPFDRGDSD